MKFFDNLTRQAVRSAKDEIMPDMRLLIPIIAAVIFLLDKPTGPNVNLTINIKGGSL